MGKVYDSSNRRSPYYLISQTPRNHVPDNYWLKELQDKVDADWDYRANRFLIEKESVFGTEQFEPLEVVLQSVKNDKNNTVISDDWRRVVFRDIHYQCPRGLKFRFSYDFLDDEPIEDKNIWLASNRNTIDPTASVIIVRCNGTIGSEYVDSKGVTRYHYEPAVQTKDLKSVNLFYNETAVGQSSDLVIIVQHNKYTRNYYVNQRFIIGYDQVYRIQAMSKFASNYTYKTDDLGTIILYLEVVEKSQYDNFETRIAYNQKERVEVEETGNDGTYSIKMELPEVIPEMLSAEPIEFKPVVYLDEAPTDLEVTTEYKLMNTANPFQPIVDEVRDKYVKFEKLEGNAFTLQKLRFYPGGNLYVTCKAQPEGRDELTYTFNMSLRGL